MAGIFERLTPQLQDPLGPSVIVAVLQDVLVALPLLQRPNNPAHRSDSPQKRDIQVVDQRDDDAILVDVEQLLSNQAEHAPWLDSPERTALPVLRMRGE